MSHPETKGRSATVAGVALVVAVVGVVVSAVALITLEVRRGEQVRDLQVQLESLRHLVEAMRHQLENHDQVINTTLLNKSAPKSEPAEEAVYEAEYEYDDEDEYDYDEENERNTKATVKRTVMLSENGSSKEQARPKRQVDKHEDSTTHSADHGKPVHHRTYPPIYQEQERAPETVRYRHKSSRARSRHTSEKDTSLEYSREISNLENLGEQQPNVAGAHFTGDTSRYNQRDHHHYYGNDILYHPHNLFKDWSPARWMTEEDLRLFPIQDGKVRVQKSGLYFVYAQIFYSATHSHCGFHINHNNEEVAQCTTSTPGHGLKRNTCFTALVLRLERQDLLWVKEVEGHRNTSFRSSHSYFGLIKLGARTDDR